MDTPNQRGASRHARADEEAQPQPDQPADARVSDIAGILRGRHQDLLDYWRQQRGTSPMPSRGQIDPIDIPQLLPHIGLVDVSDNGTAFRYRLIGWVLIEVFGVDFTGKWLHEAKSGSYARYLEELYRQAVKLERPVYAKSSFRFDDDRDLDVERLILPLSGDSGGVETLLFSNMFSAPDQDYAPFPPDRITDLSESIRLVG